MVISYEKNKLFEKISCHMIWWMSRIDDGILSQADNTAHFLGLEHALKNVEEFLKRCPFLLNVLGGIVQDIFGEIGLPEYESEEDFTSKRREKIIEWDSTKAHYSKFQPENRFLTYFLKPKVEKIKTKGIKGLSSKKIFFTDDYCQNCIAWTHYMCKSEMVVHKMTQTLEAVETGIFTYVRTERPLKQFMILGNIC